MSAMASHALRQSARYVNITRHAQPFVYCRPPVLIAEIDLAKDDRFINGEWVSASDSGRADVVDPATGERIGTVVRATREDLRRAIMPRAGLPGLFKTHRQGTVGDCPMLAAHG